MSCEHALNFDPGKTFSESYKPLSLASLMACLPNLPRIVKFTDFSPSSFKLKRGISPLLTKYVS